MQISRMASKIIFVALYIIYLSSELRPVNPETLIRAGYWSVGSKITSSDINSALFTHLICSYAVIDSTSYRIAFSQPSDETLFSTFTQTVRQKNPSVTTLLSIGNAVTNYSDFASMVSNPSYRKSFIDSSIKIARLYGFQGLDLNWAPNNSSDMFNMGVLKQYGPNVDVMYNATYCTIGTSWIGFDDVEAIRAKVSYAKEKGQLGYYVRQVADDNDWVLSQAAGTQ
ncbi:hypothetical protein Pint_14615 [Pistacia integerrima]|uniref:Uncharacterized protein n=1 Tax=Pistacia integerrima TaxID=434235 RepID=A0ACC0Y3L6_9ROSI|nr:hypothetical protein Pint_14615 [Pistacia integerrima]